MEQNPYSPPQAEVGTVGPDDQPIEKPRQVVRAVNLLWASLGLGVIIFLLELRFIQSTTGGIVAWIIPIVVWGLLSLLIVAISSGRNWARILFLVMLVIGVLPYLFSLADMFGRSYLAGSMSAGQFVCQVIAMYLVFTRPGSSWFGQRR